MSGHLQPEEGTLLLLLKRWVENCVTSRGLGIKIYRKFKIEKGEAVFKTFDYEQNLNHTFS